jgi:hypothetical protein
MKRRQGSVIVKGQEPLPRSPDFIPKFVIGFLHRFPSKTFLMELDPVAVAVDQGSN